MSPADRFLVIVPAHNEADCLPAVVAEVRATMPGVALLVVDDGSIDDTPAVLAAHGVESLRLLQGLGLARRFARDCGAPRRWATARLSVSTAMASTTRETSRRLPDPCFAGRPMS